MKNLVFSFNSFLLHLYMLDIIYNYGNFSKLILNIVTWRTCFDQFLWGLFPQTPGLGGGDLQWGMKNFHSFFMDETKVDNIRK